MAATKKSTASRRRSTAAKPSAAAQTNGGSSSKGSAGSRASAPRGSSKRRAATGAASSGGAGTKRRSNSGSQNGNARSAHVHRRSRNGSTHDGIPETIRGVGAGVVQAIDKAAKPALTVGVAAAGIAGGIALGRRQRTVLGVGLPRRAHDIDIVAVSKAVGKASMHFGQTAKNISKDIEHAAERAEKIGKILS